MKNPDFPDLRRYRTLVILCSPLLLFAVWLTVTLNFPYRGFEEERRIVEVPEGASASRVVSILEAEGIVRSRLPIRIYLALTLSSGRIQAGEYLFEKPATPAGVVGKLIRGEIQQRQVTIPEGAWLGEVVRAFVDSGIAEEESLREVLNRPDPIRDLDPRAETLEGFLFPDTYRFARGTPPEEIAEALVQRFRRALERITADPCVLAEVDVHRTVILASLIEKETGQEGERARISGVFHNRLRRSMPLQCDPTVIYALRRENRYTGRITRKDLNDTSAYNTYKHAGLPPGPIANPGEKSLLAAVCPEETDFIYFVSMNTGYHFFSRSLTEHEAAVRRYQR
ncbi:MAG: endolytic transglycosylase MltG [Acidobacteriota bacterium]